MPACPDCGKDNPDGFRFCGHCGGALAEAPATRVEERKVVTVLFCDVVGFTSASEQADPEDVLSRMQPYYARLRREIEAYGGTVEKFIGDAVMAVFGAPLAHEDDAERAIRAGLRILQAIEELNAEDASLDLSVRIGINTGEVVVSLGASPDAGEAAVHGDAVNTAARIQTAAPVNGVAVGEGTFRATERIFDFEALDPVLVKGKTTPVALWRALSPRARFGTDMRTHEGLLVGREVERSLLRGLFERAVRDTSVQLVTIVGEPGVGKSRLVWELESYIDDYPDLVAWRQGRSLPYGDGIAFWALGEIVKADAGILESDTPEVAGAKLDRAVKPDEPDREWLLRRVGTLVGIEAEATAEQDESFTAWRRYLEGIADQRPAVFVFEDLHWGDPALLEFLRHVAEWAEAVAIVLVCTARPELLDRYPDWAGGTRNATTINLEPLAPSETAELIGALLGQSLLPAEVQHPLVERSGGNPLYAEEYVRMLRDRGLLVEHGATWTLAPGAELPLPESVQALVAARLDTLSPERKAVLQDAAVLGKVFWTGAVAAMSGLEEPDVRAALHELSRRELMRPSRTSTMEGEAEHSFTHLVIRDVAYGQIPRAARAAKHRAAAAWIGAKAGERIEDLAEVLAYHVTEALELVQSAGLDAESAELRDAARRYLVMAGDRAMRLEIGRALDLYRRALGLTPHGHDERPAVLELVAKAGAYADSREEALAAFEEAVALYETRGDLLSLGRLLTSGAVILRHQGAAQAGASARAAIDALEQLPAGPELVDAYAAWAGMEYVQGNDSEAVEWAERSLALQASLGLPPSAFALSRRGAARVGLGDSGGLEDLRQALPLFDETRTREHVLALNNLGVSIFPFEGPAAGIVGIRQAIELSRRRGLVEGERLLAATAVELLYPLGDWDEALAQAESIASTATATDWVWVFVAGVSCDILLARGETESAATRAESIIDSARSLGEVQVLLPVLQVAAHAAARRGRTAEASTLLGELEQVPGVHSSWNLPTYLPSIARVALEVGRPEIATALVSGFPRITPLHEHAHVAAEAIFAEADGDLERAVRLYEDAAERWRSFGYVPETAFSELGRGRCLLALGQREVAAEALEAGRKIFARLGATPYQAEIDNLLTPIERLSSEAG